MGSHGHQHDASRSAGRRALWIAFLLTAGYLVAEVIGGLLAGSLALIADAAHMVTDALSIGLALVALWLSSRPASAQHTFGMYRAEVLAAGLNAASLWLVSGWIFYQAFQRFSDPSEVAGPLTLSVGSIGLLINLLAAWVLRRSAGENLNVQGAFLHVAGDLLGSIGVVAAAVMVMAFGWQIADPIFGVLIGVLVLITSTRLAIRVLQVLMEASPPGVDVTELCSALEGVEGVESVHDIHLSSVTQDYNVLSGHVVKSQASARSFESLLTDLRSIASRRFGIEHVTLQLEADASLCVERHHAAH